MNRNIIEGQWDTLKGNVRTKWGKLTNDDVEQAQGKFEKLSGALQTRYGMAKDKAEQELDAFILSIANTAEKAVKGAEKVVDKVIDKAGSKDGNSARPR